MQLSGIEILERHARAGIWSFDLETQAIHWSDGIYAIHGLDRASFTPQLDSALSFYTSESRDALSQAIDRAQRQGSGYSLTVELIRADGARRHVQAIGQVELRDGQQPLLAGALLDVHDQVKERNISAARERRLAVENKRWRTAGENAGLGLIDIDLYEDLYRVYGRFNSRIGLSHADESAIDRDKWYSWIGENDRRERKKRIDAHLEANTADYSCEYRLQLPGRDPVWLRERGRLVDTDEGRRIVGTVSDITAERAAQDALRVSKRRLTQTLTQAPTGIALVSPQGRWLTVNRALCEILGYDELELLERTFQDITHPDDLETDLDYVDDLLSGRKLTGRMEKRYFHKQGHSVDVQLDVSLLRDDAGEPLYFICHIQDISESKRTLHELFEAKELADITFESIGEGVIRIDVNGRISELNSASVQLLGGTREQMLGEYFGDVVRFYDPDDEVPIDDPMPRVLGEGDRVRVPIFTRLRRRDGEFISIVDSISPIHDETGDVRGAVFVFQDISEARRVTQELMHEASHDPLTGLPNRRGFDEALARTWMRVQQGALHAFVMYLDLDHFKAVNDICGHAAGDELLQQIAQAMYSLLRDSDVLARLGGDEFAAIVHAGDADGARVVADKIIQRVRDYEFTYDGRSFKVGVSIGVAELDRGLDSTDSVLLHADTALYAAKNAGRNRYEFYQDSAAEGDQAVANLGAPELLQRGLDKDEFILYLQAVVDGDGTPVGYEALLRLSEPDGVIRPETFLPIATRLGMMSRIDRWVLRHALHLIEAYEQRGLWPEGCYLSINISPISVADPLFHAELISMLDQHEVGAGRLVFEVTESEALFGEHYPRLIQNLRDRGFEVWLDDFAGGHTGFDILKHASVDGIKIDRAFVRNLEHDPIDRAVLRSIADVAATLDINIIAEGVETQAALELLKRANVRQFQGYYFHRPEPVEAALVHTAALSERSVSSLSVTTPRV
jgi:diguanylate cyclase (GGDEF)-like protein/PAS domain S-box-containing protein